MQKTAVVYDKWLDTLGGGEFMACKVARCLIEENYNVTFVCGKLVSKKTIIDKLNIDLEKAEFIALWNDEPRLKDITKGKDLFINASFMDYSFGYAKKNIYITYFPTKANENIKGYIINSLITPIFTKVSKPIEFIIQPDFVRYYHGHLLYTVNKESKVAYYRLTKGKTYTIKFSVMFKEFTKTYLENIFATFDNADIISNTYKIIHSRNQIIFRYSVRPKSETIYLKFLNHNQDLPNNVELILDKIKPVYGFEKLLSPITQKITDRIRAGVFVNVKKRMEKYDKIIAISEFTRSGIKKYWGHNSVILYPPVDMLYNENVKKKNYIISIGRFFTLGHGKKQEILIEAFKKIHKKQRTNWELHLVGGLGSEPTSQAFANHLKEISNGYPIFFHFNVSRKILVSLLHKSKIYWHATGFGENESINPMKFEHFGIAPIEAISAGCKPVLYKGGGLPDIIKTLKLSNKSLFTSIGELTDNTVEIINNEINFGLEEKTKKILNNTYSDQAFKKNLFKIIND